MKLKLYMILFGMIMLTLEGCSDAEPPNPIVPGTQLIAFVYDSSSQTFSYHMPDDVKSAVLWVYQGGIPSFDGNELVNPNGIVAGAYPISANFMQANNTSLMDCIWW